MNWTKVQECRQRPSEHPSDFWGWLWQALGKYGGMTPWNFNGALAVNMFVDEASPDIRKY